MIDHFWLNVAQGSQFGGGVEGIPLGIGHLDVAAFENKDRNVSDLAGGGARDNLYSHTLDLRYRGIPTVKDGDLTLWAFGAQRQGNDNINYDDRTGYALGGWHTLQNVRGGRLVTGFAYRHGVAMQQGLFDSHAIREDQGFDTTGAWSAEINNDWLAEYNDKDYAIQWVNVLRHEERGKTGVSGSTIDWVSTGGRPVFFLTDHISLATEAGIDYVNNEIAGAEGYLGKGTVALQFTQKKGFFERPMIRVFATGAKWSDSFRGMIGNGSPAAATSYANSTAGASYGIQFEWWW
jgi:maltoporin